jgi:hypothetical protein
MGLLLERHSVFAWGFGCFGRVSEPRGKMMETYKNYPICGSGIPAELMKVPGWYARGIILDPQAEVPTELKRIDCEEILFITKEEAETHALILCKTWIDERA